MFQAVEKVGRAITAPTLTLRTHIVDVNGDARVNVLDLVVIASEIENTGTNQAADVNRDGVISILDLILVANMFVIERIQSKVLDGKRFELMAVSPD